MIDRFSNELDITEIFEESELSTKDRNKLDDSDFGIPELREYPLTDESHVLQAVRFFNKAPEEYKHELARNIVKRVKALDMEWNNWDVLKPYLDKPVKESYVQEGLFFNKKEYTAPQISETYQEFVDAYNDQTFKSIISVFKNRKSKLLSNWMNENFPVDGYRSVEDNDGTVVEFLSKDRVDEFTVSDNKYNTIGFGFATVRNPDEWLTICMTDGKVYYCDIRPDSVIANSFNEFLKSFGSTFDQYLKKYLKRSETDTFYKELKSELDQTVQESEYYSKGEPFYEGVAKNKKSDNMSTERVIDDELRSMLKSESIKPKREQPSSLFGRWLMEADDETEENEDIEENDEETEEKDTEEDDDDLEKIDKDFQDLEGFGSDDSDVQNEYDEKEVETLNNLIAAENDAMNDYFDAGKNTNQEILRRLYADIGAEERFHAEQLIYAKCTLTGEKYEPRDPKVKEEYQELLEMGMDEDTAIYTTIDKMSLSQSSDEMTDEDMKDIQEDVATTESMLLQNELILDTILENANFLTNKISEQYESFVEQYVYLEDVSNVSTAPKSLQKGQSPIRFIAKSFSNIIKFLMNLARRIREYMTRSRIKRDKIKRWVKNHGVKAVFEPGYSFYFYDDKTGKFNTNDALKYCDLLFKLTKQIADRCGLSLNFNNPVRINNTIGYGSIERGIELINGVVMSKTKVVITDKNESYFRHVLFGYSDTKIPMIKTENDENGDEVNKLENESFNIYNSFTAILSIISQCSKLTNEVVIAMANLEGDPNSVYRSNYSEYRKMVKNISIVVKGYNTIIKALNADLNTMLKIDNGVLEMTKAHDEADRNGQQWDGGTDDYNPNDGSQQPQQKSQTPHVTPKQTMRSRLNNNVMPSV